MNAGARILPYFATPLGGATNRGATGQMTSHSLSTKTPLFDLFDTFLSCFTDENEGIKNTVKNDNPGDFIIRVGDPLFFGFFL